MNVTTHDSHVYSPQHSPSLETCPVQRAEAARVATAAFHEQCRAQRVVATSATVPNPLVPTADLIPVAITGTTEEMGSILVGGVPGGQQCWQVLGVAVVVGSC